MKQMNKKGEIMSVIWIVVFLFLLLFLGLFLAFGGLVIDWTADIVVPELKTIGMVGSTNLSQYTGYAITPVDNLVQSFTWLTGFIYVLALVGCLGMAFVFRFTGSKWLLGFFIMCMLMLVIASVFISNIYQDFYDDTTDIGSRLHDQVMLSWFILYSPLVITLIGFICGVIMFTGEGEETIV